MLIRLNLFDCTYIIRSYSSVSSDTKNERLLADVTYMEIRDNHSLNLYPLTAVIIQDKRYRSCVCRVVLNITLCLPVVGLQVNGRYSNGPYEHLMWTEQRSQRLYVLLVIS
jgi:hypothetical protein